MKGLELPAVLTNHVICHQQICRAVGYPQYEQPCHEYSQLDRHGHRPTHELKHHEQDGREQQE